VVKKMFGYDDALDTFGVHAVGGTLGALLSGFLATEDVNSNLVGSYAQANGLDKILESGMLWMEQLKAIGVTLALSIGGDPGHHADRQGAHRPAPERRGRRYRSRPGRARGSWLRNVRLVPRP